MKNSKIMDPIPKHQLEAMHTGSLLKRLEQLRALHENFHHSDWTEQERDENRHLIAFKNTDIWQKAWADIKDVLSKREHVEQGSKAKRQKDTFAKQNR